MSKIESLILYITFGLLLFGIVMSRADQYWFDFTYAVEDGFIEWMTVIALCVILGACLVRFWNLKNRRKPFFLFALLVLAGLCLFVAGEELSWGQRLFQVKSSEFFTRNNSQRETNFHNLVVAGKSINLIIFSRLLILVIAFYLLVLPVLYKRSSKIRDFVNQSAVPVPQWYQTVSLLLVFSLIALCPSGKRAELLEFGTCFMFMSIVLFPKNAAIFK